MYLATGMWTAVVFLAASSFGFLNTIVNAGVWIGGGLELLEFAIWLIAGGDISLFLESPMTDEKMQILMGLGGVLSATTLAVGIYLTDEDQLGGRKSQLLLGSIIVWPLVGLVTAITSVRYLIDAN